MASVASPGDWRGRDCAMTRSSGDMDRLFANWAWQPPEHWTRITTIEMHTGGEPLRVLVSGLPPIEGRTVLEKRRYFSEHYDHIRKGTMWEPRGHADMYGAVITSSLNADFDVFFLHNEGYSTMCGHAIIALTKLVIETGLVRKEESNPQIAFNVPAGRVHARAVIEDGKVREASFRNVPSFVYLRDRQVEVPGLGLVRFDVAYGGAFCAFVSRLRIIPGSSIMAGGSRMQLLHSFRSNIPSRKI